eukprot:1710598-Alexandrium_andersonii.AAC.1
MSTRVRYAVVGNTSVEQSTTQDRPRQSQGISISYGVSMGVAVLKSLTLILDGKRASTVLGAPNGSS